MSISFAPGSTSKSIDIRVYDDDGLPVTGLVAATMPTVKFSLAGANADVTISLSDLATIGTAWASGGLKERGEGVYRLDLPDAALATAGQVTVRAEATGKRLICPVITVQAAALTAATTRAALGMAAADLDTQLDAITARTDLIGTGEAVVVSPVASSGGIDIVIGSSYYDADSRALTWTDSGSAWPALTGGSISLELWLTGASAAALTVAGTVVDANTARVELTSVQTATLSPRVYGMFLKATLSNGHVVVLVREKARVVNATE